MNTFQTCLRFEKNKITIPSYRSRARFFPFYNNWRISKEKEVPKATKLNGRVITHRPLPWRCEAFGCQEPKRTLNNVFWLSSPYLVVQPFQCHILFHLCLDVLLRDNLTEKILEWCAIPKGTYKALRSTGLLQLQ